MLNKIFKVLENLKHNGVDYKAGQYTAEQFPQELIDSGTVKIIDGASTVEEAKDLDSESSEQVEEAPEEEVEPKGTWGPKKDEEVPEEENEVELPENAEYDGPMEYYKVVGEVHPLNEDGTEKDETLEIGSIHYLPTNAVDLETNQWAIATEEEVASMKGEAPAEVGAGAVDTQ